MLSTMTMDLLAAGAGSFPGGWVKGAINALTKPEYFITLATVAFALMFVLYKWWTRPLVFGAIFTLFCVFYFGSIADPDFRSIVAKPDNVPITIMVITVLL